MPEEIRVAVAGGDLAAVRWPATAAAAPTVIALHGITANALCWSAVAAALAGRVTLVAPDLRGRAHSNHLPGPYGLATHIDDAAAVAAALAPAAPPTLVGHSLGGFVAAATLAAHPAQFGGGVLVDGGVVFRRPGGLDGDELLNAVLGPAMRRLGMSFPDRDAYRAFWQHHPAFAGIPWTAAIDAYIQRDLTGREPNLTSSCLVEAVRADAVAPFTARASRVVDALPFPVQLLWAERGLLNEPHGVYDEGWFRTIGLDRTPVRPRPAPGANHYTLLVAADGARRVAEAIVTATTDPR